MTIQPLGPWLPDKPPIRGPHLRDAKGVLPTLEGYAPLPGLAATTNALSNQCLGATAARDILSAAHMYAGDASKLYANLSGTWTDQSKGGGYGPATAQTRWRFTAYGDRLIAVNGVDAPQYIDMSIGSAFANLGGSPGVASYCATFGEFVFLAATATNSMAVKWSGFGDSAGWTAGTNQSDEQDFADGGRITGLGVTQAALYLFQEKSIRRFLYVGGDTIFQIDQLVQGIGCAEPNSLVQFGQRFFFLSEDGLYQFDGASEPTPIGVEAFSAWFLADASRQYWRTMSAAIDPRKKVVAWAYASINSGMGIPDSVLFYNYALDRASYARLDTEFIIGAISLGASRDDAAFSGMSADDAAFATLSSDDPSFLGGTFYLAAFNTAHKLASFASSNVEATIETGRAPLMPGGRATVKWIQPITDSPNVTAAAGSQVKASDAIVFVSPVSKQASGRCPQRGANGFFLAGKFVIPAADTWTFFNGFDFEAANAGRR